MAGNGVLARPGKGPPARLGLTLRGLSRGVRGGGIGGQTRDRNRRVPFPASGSGAILAGGFGKGSPGSIPVPTITTMPITTPFDLVPVFQVFQVILSPMAFGRPPSLERASGTQLTPPPSSRFQLAIDIQQRQAR